LLIREILPVIKYEELVVVGDPPESCAVCLYEFEGGEEIRWLRNCRHVFHRACLDRWMDHDKKTCPLCRTSFVPDELQDEFNQRLWAASGIADFYGEYSSVPGLRRRFALPNGICAYAHFAYEKVFILFFLCGKLGHGKVSVHCGLQHRSMRLFFSEIFLYALRRGGLPCGRANG
ncbi:hypothetical protein Goari_011936, partial [Gossypium aridum]|nr:hypothetical protein [Gossypium aridum]